MTTHNLMAVGSNGTTVHGIDPKRPRADLLDRVGGMDADPTYVDTSAGAARPTGYVVSFGADYEDEWFTFFEVRPWSGRRNGREPSATRRGHAERKGCGL